jgi:hypothetical protein
MRFNKIALICMAISILTNIGCVTVPHKERYTIGIDSIASKKANEKIYYILLPGNKDENVDNLKYKEFAKYVNRALKLSGFIHVKHQEDADIMIFLTYDIGDPKEHVYTYAIPVFGQTGYSSSHTSGTLKSYGNYGTYSKTTTYTPSFGIKGYGTGVGSFITYFKYIVLDAYDLKKYAKSNKMIQVWRTTITNNGESGDLRKMFPRMLGGALGYIGEDTEQLETFNIEEGHPDIDAILGK